MSTLREYQARAVATVVDAWASGQRAVCLVSPTGSGKTRMGVELASGRVLWIAHRRELLSQARDALLANGAQSVGIVAPGHVYDASCRVQVASVQTLLARGERPAASLVVYDEAHHYIADDWKRVSEAYPSAAVLGLTATPQRADGKPLGDMFDRLVVAAQYSELVRLGHIVRCKAFQPPEVQQANALAKDPVAAYKLHAPGTLAFCFVQNVKVAHECAARFCEHEVGAAVIEAETPPQERRDILRDFAAGRIRVLVNVYTMTEGVDVPQAQTVILARGVGKQGPYLQMAGRVLRPHPSKDHAILIDLSGASIVHGLPTDDRLYSLDGDGVRRASETPLRYCPECGATYEGGPDCPECGCVRESPAKPPPAIYDLDLREVWAGAATPDDAKERERQRLLTMARLKGWSLGWVAREYRKLFSEPPWLGDVPDDERCAEFGRLRAMGEERGYKPGFAAVRFKDLFGAWPPRGWAA